MLVLVRGWWEDLQDSLWLMPGATVVATIVVANLLVSLTPEAGWLPSILRFEAGPDGAREVLSQLAGATFTVVGVVFSPPVSSTTSWPGSSTPGPSSDPTGPSRATSPSGSDSSRTSRAVPCRRASTTRPRPSRPTERATDLSDPVEVARVERAAETARRTLELGRRPPAGVDAG